MATHTSAVRPRRPRGEFRIVASFIGTLTLLGIIVLAYGLDWMAMTYAPPLP